MRRIIVNENGKKVINKTDDGIHQEPTDTTGAMKVNHVNKGKDDSSNSTTQIVGNVKLSKISILLVALLNQLIDLAARYAPNFIAWIESMFQ